MNQHPVLDGLAAAGIRLGLDRIRTFLEVLGAPQLCAPAVHVAGTNGKGSTCAFVTAALVEAGYTVGTTISPHIEQINERVQIQGVPVDDGTLAEAIEHVDRTRRDWAEQSGIDGEPLTYFEFMIAVAFQVFAWRKVDVMVVEVGLGGRLDATRVIQPVATAITSISLDHQEILGPDVATIATEKAGILERGVPVTIGALPVEARQVVEARARALGCLLWAPSPNLRKELHRDGTYSFATPGGAVDRVRLGLRGAHQGGNALVALGVLHQLRGQGFHIPDDAIRRGLERAFIGGRLEQLLPGLVVDGAHNPEGSAALARWLAERPKTGLRILLFGMGEGRDAMEVLAPLLPHVDEVVTTRCRHPKARDPVELALAVQDIEVDLAAGADIEVTLPEVYGEAHETVVAGSMFLVGAARSLVAAGALDGIVPGQGRSEPLDEMEP